MAVGRARHLRKALDQRHVRSRTALRLSAVEPFRSTMAFWVDPLATSVARKPWAIASVITKTATTIAMPPAVIAAVPLRTTIERRL